jgi:hypothetical protein
MSLMTPSMPIGGGGSDGAAATAATQVRITRDLFVYSHTRRVENVRVC